MIKPNYNVHVDAKCHRVMSGVVSCHKAKFYMVLFDLVDSVMKQCTVG